MQGQKNLAPHITQLPFELLLNIFNYLTLIERVHAGYVCRLYQCVFKDNYFWRQIWREYFSSLESKAINLSNAYWYEYTYAAYLRHYQGLPKLPRLVFLQLKQHALAPCINLNSKDVYGKTLLDWAASKGLVSIFKRLLQRGAKIKYAEHPLYWAALGGHIAMLRFLLNKQLNIDMLDAKGRSALLGAREGNHPETVVFLLRYQAKILNVEALLFWAVAHGYVRVLRRLFARNINLNIGGILRGTPLLCAAKNGQLAVVKLLLAHGAPINVGWLWQTPLFWAARMNHLEVAFYLVAQGANIEQQPYYLLHWAVANDRIDFASVLLSRGLAIDIQDNFGNTALHVAALYAEERMLTWLLRQGANQNLVNHKKLTALMLAEDCGHQMIVAHLKAAAAEENSLSMVFFPVSLTQASRHVENYSSP